MKKTIILILIISFIIFLISGYYDAKSLETFHYAIAIGIDKGENSKIKLSIQIALSDSKRRIFFSIY